MRLSHTRAAIAVSFDDPNLVSAAGLVPVMRLAAAAGLGGLADDHLTVPTDKGANAGGKVSALVAGMVAGADSIDDLALLRHGGMGTLFTRPYAPSTLGSFLRAFTFGHVRQLDAVASRFLAGRNAGDVAGRTGAQRHTPLRGGARRHPAHTPDQRHGPPRPPATPPRAAPTHALAPRHPMAHLLESRLHDLTNDHPARTTHHHTHTPPDEREAEQAGHQVSRSDAPSTSQDNHDKSKDHPDADPRIEA